MKTSFPILLLDPSSLKGRMIIASGWSVLQIVATNLLRLSSNLIMTRLLLPEAFGLMALVTTLITAFNLFSDVGLERSIVREPDGDSPRFLRVAWVVKIMRGGAIAACVLVAALLVWLLAPWLAPEGSVYADPKLPGLLALVALVPLMQGCQSTCKELTTRNMQNTRYTILDVSGQVVGIACMVAFAQISPTVWALLAGLLMINVYGLIMTHTVYPGPRMDFIWDAEIADRLWRYGKFLMGSSALTFVARYADRLMLGGFLGATTFGIYTIAMIWVEAGIALLNRIASRSGFPGIAQVVRNRPHDVPRLFRKFQTVIDLACLAAFLLMFLFGNALIGLLYTETYAQAGRFLQLMSVSFLSARFTTLGMLLMNVGNSRAMMISSGIKAAAICALLPLAYSYVGLHGVLLVAALTPVSSAPYVIATLRPVLGARQCRIDALILCAILGLAAAVFLLSAPPGAQSI